MMYLQKSRGCSHLISYKTTIEVQKSATPVPTPARVEEACALLETKNINAVVSEKSCQDEVDINAQQNAVLLKLIAKLK